MRRYHGHAMPERSNAPGERGHAMPERSNTPRERGHAMPERSNAPGERGHAMLERSNAPGERGHAMLELAISAGVMVSCLVGTFQFGYTFYTYNQLVTAVGNGARYAAQRTYRAGTAQDLDRGVTAIRNMVVYGDPQPSPEAAPVVPKLTPAEVDVRWDLAGDGAPLNVNITIKGYTMDAIFRSFTFDGRPSVQFPYVGKYAPAEREP